MMPLRLVASMLPLSLILPGTGLVYGQAFPYKPVRIATGAAGGGSDFDARQISQAISGRLGQPVIVDNRANGLIAGEIVSKAAPDGYTLLLTGASHWITPLLQKVPYDVVTDFSPISMIDSSVKVIVVHPSLPVQSVKELIALAKAKPGQLNYAASARGSADHLAAELFKSMAGVNIVNVPYKGNAAALTALLSSEVQLTLTDAGLMAPLVKSGKLRALAVTGAEPSSLAPGFPTVMASGLPGYEAEGATAMFGPGKMPAAIINRLNQEIVRFLRTAEAKERFFSNGAEIVASSPEQLAATVKSQIIKWAAVIKDAGIKVD